MLNRRTFFISGAVSLMFYNDKAFSTEINRAVKLNNDRVGYDRLWLRRENVEDMIVFRDRQNNMNVFPNECFRLSYFWRDVVDNKIAPISVALFDVVSRTQTVLSQIFNKPLPVIVTSGYRTERHNQTIEGAAQNSEHLRGRAIDMVIPDVNPQQVAVAGAHLGAGGIGVYKKFTHLDVGQTGRRWYG